MLRIDDGVEAQVELSGRARSCSAGIHAMLTDVPLKAWPQDTVPAAGRNVAMLFHCSSSTWGRGRIV
jgi:hypothetical protein